MDFSKVSYAQITSSANELKSSSERMTQLIEELKSIFNKIGDESVWSGTAASQTKEAFDTLSARMPEFSAALAECQQYLLKVVENYQSVDRVINGQN